MTASSAISRPGERARTSSKLAALDWNLAIMIAVIAGAGGLMMFSIADSSWQPWAFNHLSRFGVCYIAMILLALVDLRVWFAVAYPVYFVALGLLIGVEVAGVTVMGATRWLDLGITRIQPSEIMKVGIVLALARFYHGVGARTAELSWKLLVPAALIAAPVVLVAHQPDLGSSLLILFTGVAIMVLAGLSWRLIGAGVLAGIAAAPIMYFFVLHEYQRTRVDVLLNPAADASGAGYHITQALIGIGSGGLFGRGYGLGSQAQLNYLPEKQTDFIFATLAEEFGFIGSAGVLLLYGAVIMSSLRIASLSHSHFGRLGASGMVATFALYVLINGAMVMGLAPVVGVPMPLLSYGGTVMMTVMIGFGLVQAVKVNRYAELSSGKGSLI